MPTSNLLNNSYNWEAETRRSRVANTEPFSSLNRASYYPNGTPMLHAAEARIARRPSIDSEQTPRISPDPWEPVQYSVPDTTDNATYGRTIPADPWEQLQYRTRGASAVRGVHSSSTIVDDVEYRTVDSVWNQPTRTVTAEDLRRAYTNLDSSARIDRTLISLEELYQSIYSVEAAFSSCGVSAQPTRPRITFGEL